MVEERGWKRWRETAGVGEERSRGQGDSLGEGSSQEGGGERRSGLWCLWAMIDRIAHAKGKRYCKACAANDLAATHGHTFACCPTQRGKYALLTSWDFADKVVSPLSGIGLVTQPCRPCCYNVTSTLAPP